MIPTSQIPTSHDHPVRRSRRASVLRAAAVASVLSLPVTAVVAPVGAQTEGRGGGQSSFVEVGRLPVPLGSTPEDSATADEADQSGWLILDTRSRRAYEVFETSGGIILQSFDLDTLAPIRRAPLRTRGIPVYGGPRAVLGAGVTSGNAGEIVHAVDEQAGRLYLAVSDTLGNAVGTGIAYNSSSADGNRPVTDYVVVDEERFNGGAEVFSASVVEPNQPGAWLRSLAVDHSSAPARSGNLVSVVTLAHAVESPAVHQLRQWDLSTLAVGTHDAPPPVGTTTALTACAGSSMLDGSAGEGNFQWGLLLRDDGAYLGCQASVGSARAVHVPLDGVGEQRAYQLSRPVADVIVDQGAGRLLFKSIDGSNRTWWVFDAAAKRFTGALAALLSLDRMGVGIDEATGRLYMLIPDYVGNDEGRSFAVRGGLHTADTRLDPVPPAENVAPELAYPGVFRIGVDPARDGRPTRIFVRRGAFGASPRYVYPATQPSAPAPVEPHYLVLRDDKPILEQVVEGPEADRRFTTNVPEAEGVTKASYQASGSGYGSRTLLVGGIDAATGRHVSGPVAPDCDKTDREVIVGQVEQASLSDVSAAATAASLAADLQTEEQAGRLGPSCNDEHGGGVPATTVVEFDGPDKGEESDFRTECVEDADPDPRKPPDASVVAGDDRHTLGGSRAGYVADVGCRQSQSSVTAKATGTLGVLADVSVGHAESTVTVKRRDAGGVVVTVDSIARDIVIEGLGSATGRIGVVRAEAVSEAAGRDGTAEGRFVRHVCAVDIPAVLTTPHCLGDSAQRELEAKFKERFSGQAELRFRTPDARLLKGSTSGYRAGVQRQALDLFQDSSISKDVSLAVPALELVVFQGDSAEKGAGRQIVQLAGAQAGTSYGIACLNGPGKEGGCASGPDDRPEPPEFTPPTVGPDGNLVYASPADGGSGGGGKGGGGGILRRIGDALTAPFRLAADVLRLLFSNPREFALMAAVWALLFLPCYLGERRRTLQGLAARRVATGGA